MLFYFNMNILGGYKNSKKSVFSFFFVLLYDFSCEILEVLRFLSGFFRFEGTCATEKVFFQNKKQYS